MIDPIPQGWLGDVLQSIAGVVLLVVLVVLVRATLIHTVRWLAGPRCGALPKPSDPRMPWDEHPCVLRRGHAGEHRDRNGLWWR